MRGMTMRVAIMTVSDGVAAGEREDRGGPACEEALRASGIAHSHDLPGQVRGREIRTGVGAHLLGQAGDLKLDDFPDGFRSAVSRRHTRSSRQDDQVGVA